MAEYGDIVKTTKDDPDCCQYDNCINKRYKTSNFCLVHGGNKAVERDRKISLRNYKLTQYNARILDKTRSDARKSLHEEVGILRLVLEEKINSCDSTADLIMQSGAISELVTKIEKIVQSAHKMDVVMRQVLSAEALDTLADQMINIISTKIDDPELVDEIARAFADCLSDPEISDEP